ncbi:NusB antitermination factor [Propionispira arboris]|uniref:16S rRNA (cytosine(967)-C(5))-methyltransferase n=1 Tax=Propionispira arboris TaxID=84035 RepID=A0A1H6WBD6_9FIRM|nr:16S rRNA (cytosine(967)-C(5))-methyltransferase RsmB [Propionispira arboris]SEJ11367.1 NusB antitermination factor [Propionispira arboris]
MNAREIALKIINDVHTNDAYANVSLTRELRKHEVSDQDRRFVTELVYGCVKAGDSLDWILSQYINRPIKKIAPIIQDVLRLGIYQIFFMDKVPESAACNQSVELAKKYGHIGTVKFVNAVLRNAVRQPEKAVYPNGKGQATKYAALAYNHPEWLVKRWIKEFGYDMAVKLCEFNNTNAALSIRTNTLKTNRSDLMNILSAEQVVCYESEWTPEGLVCQSHPAMDQIKSLTEGLFQVQDESSMLVAHVLDPQPGEFIIDTCSAPGGKTTHIAALMQNKGRVLATDIYEHKLKRVNENAERLGIQIIQTELLDATQIGDVYEQQADRVLVDAPCSGLGVLRRKPDARWKKSPALLVELPKLQIEILKSAAKAVKPGGVLVYSTCTIAKEENQTVVNLFLADHPEFELEQTGQFLPYAKQKTTMVQLLPHIAGTDGFFIARMKRK